MLSNQLTTTTITNETKISRSNINDWIRGDKLPSSKALITLYEHYKLPISYILTGDNNIKESKLLIDIFSKLDDTNKQIAEIELKRLYDLQKIKKVEH